MRDILDHVPDAVKNVVDALSLTLILGTLVDVLPSIAAVLSIIWSLIRISETETVRRLFKRKPRDPD
jgi:hypothetical protein